MGRLLIPMQMPVGMYIILVLGLVLGVAFAAFLAKGAVRPKASRDAVVKENWPLVAGILACASPFMVMSLSALVLAFPTGGDSFVAAGQAWGWETPPGMSADVACAVNDSTKMWAQERLGEVCVPATREVLDMTPDPPDPWLGAGLWFSFVVSLICLAAYLLCREVWRRRLYHEPPKVDIR